MSDAKSTKFFRPWNVFDSEERTEVSEQEDTQTGTVGIPVVEEDRRSSASISIYEEISAASSSENETCSLNSTGGRRRRRSESSAEASSRSGSVNSEDATRSSSLDLLNKFVLGSSNTTTCTVPRVVQSDSSIPEPYPVMSGYPVYGPTYPVEYLQRLNIPQIHSLQSLNAGPSTVPIEVSSRQTATVSTTGQSFYCGFPAVHHLPQGLYAPMMEQAVEMLHRQDAVAKQMKKLRPKKFRCEHCDVAFSNNGQLKGHIRIHTGERPFKCDAEGCGKSFTRNEELTRHKRIHTGLRPHACIICGKCFGRKDHLKKHMRTHENRDPYRMSAAALGMFALGHTLPQGHSFSPYGYPM